MVSVGRDRFTVWQGECSEVEKCSRGEWTLQGLHLCLVQEASRLGVEQPGCITAPHCRSYGYHFKLTLHYYSFVCCGWLCPTGPMQKLKVPLKLRQVLIYCQPLRVQAGKELAPSPWISMKRKVPKFAHHKQIPCVKSESSLSLDSVQDIPDSFCPAPWT